MVLWLVIQRARTPAVQKTETTRSHSRWEPHAFRVDLIDLWMPFILNLFDLRITYSFSISQVFLPERGRPRPQPCEQCFLQTSSK